MHNESNKNVIDLELGAKIIQSDIAAAKELLCCLMNTLPEAEKNLAQALQKKDWSTLALVAHKLHGGTAYCGTPCLKNAVHDLEQALKLGTVDGIDALYQRVCAEIDALKREYAKL